MHTRLCGGETGREVAVEGHDRPEPGTNQGEVEGTLLNTLQRFRVRTTRSWDAVPNDDSDAPASLEVHRNPLARQSAVEVEVAQEEEQEEEHDPGSGIGDVIMAEDIIRVLP